MKKILLTFVAALTVCSVCVFGTGMMMNCHDHEQDEQGLCYRETEEGEYFVMEYRKEVFSEVVIPSAVNGKPVVGIDEEAFGGCPATSITLPESITFIGKEAFGGCNNLEKITVAESNTKYHSAGNCLIETESKTLIAGCKNSVIPGDGSVTAINDGAFYYIKSLADITIPDSITTIGRDAFMGCAGLQTVTIGSGVTGIGPCAFCDCSSLTSIVIPEKVTEIEYSTFYRCTELITVILSDGVTSIGEYAFEHCSSLTTLTVPGSVNCIEQRAFCMCENLTKITFNGTKEQWDNIEKGSNWNYNCGDYVGYCTDGKFYK